ETAEVEAGPRDIERQEEREWDGSFHVRMKLKVPNERSRDRLIIICCGAQNIRMVAMAWGLRAYRMGWDGQKTASAKHRFMNCNPSEAVRTQRAARQRPAACRARAWEYNVRDSRKKMKFHDRMRVIAAPSSCKTLLIFFKTLFRP